MKNLRSGKLRADFSFPIVLLESPFLAIHPVLHCQPEVQQTSLLMAEKAKGGELEGVRRYHLPQDYHMTAPYILSSNMLGALITLQKSHCSCF